jgi:hypothetical protein
MDRLPHEFPNEVPHMSGYGKALTEEQYQLLYDMAATEEVTNMEAGEYSLRPERVMYVDMYDM